MTEANCIFLGNLLRRCAPPYKTTDSMVRPSSKPKNGKPLSVTGIGLISMLVLFVIVSMLQPSSPDTLSIDSSTSVRGPVPVQAAGNAGKTKLLDSIAYVAFPMNRETGKIKLPKEVETVVIDIGARGSDYLGTMEKTEDNHTAIFLFDPLPDSGMPLTQRVAEYSLRNRGRKWLDKTKKNRVFYTRAAMGEKEEIVDFNIALGPACGSILKTHSNNTFWCADVKDKVSTVVLTLADFVPLIPKGGSSPITQIHLKVDAEGADLAVLRGAREAILMIDTVVIECKADSNEKTFREGECVASDAVKYMVEDMGFRLYEVELQGGLVNIYWVNPKFKGPLPEFLQQPSLNFYGKFYKHLDDAWLKKSS